jgi:hypothetical protein
MIRLLARLPPPLHEDQRGNGNQMPLRVMMTGNAP